MTFALLATLPTFIVSTAVASINPLFDDIVSLLCRIYPPVGVAF